MSQPNIRFHELPHEILFIILKNLNNMDVLYSLYDLDHQRFNLFLQHETFSHTLNFTQKTLTDDVMPLPDLIFNRFCIEILPKMNHCIRFLIVEPTSLERILHAGDYPSLTQLQIFNFSQQVVVNYFTDQFSCHRVLREQITHLILVPSCEHVVSLTTIWSRPYPHGIHGYIIQFFKNLQHLSVENDDVLSLGNNCALTTCSSSILNTLYACVNNFNDCLTLLDGRLKNLNTFDVQIHHGPRIAPRIYNIDDLPNLINFSLNYSGENDEYDTLILPLLRRMKNLKHLKLNITIQHGEKIIDGTQIGQALIYMSQLQNFNFYISNDGVLNVSVPCLSSEEIRRTFADIGYQDVDCILNTRKIASTYYIFSLPYPFDYLDLTDSAGLSTIYTGVSLLSFSDDVPFKYDFFIRIAHCFPQLKKLSILNTVGQENDINEELNDLIEYPYLIELLLFDTHSDYVEQLFNETKIRLPRLHRLTVDYDQLVAATNNFTKETTRNNCAKVKQLRMDAIRVHSKDFYDYFPLLSVCCESDSYLRSL